MIHERSKLNQPIGRTLFGNNYHMMAENYTEEGTRRSIRKQILSKFGRLLPVNYSYEMGIQQSNKSPKECEAHQTSFNEVKLTLPALNMNKNSFE